MRSTPGSITRVLLALVLLVSMLGVVACSSDSAEETSAESSESATQEDGAEAESEESEESEESADAGSGDGLTASQEEAAIDIAGAYMAGTSDFTSADFDFTVEASAMDGEGQWWARITASPHDTSFETEQIYVYSPTDSDFWFVHTSGTGVDAASDESFPEEVREALAW